MEIKKGRIIKLLGGFYYILAEDNIYECRARGLFRNNDIKPVVGDLAAFQVDSLNTDKGYILELMQRSSLFIRPEVANIEQLVIVFAMKSPTPNFYLLDTLLLHTDIHGIKPILCFNKADLASQEEVASLKRIYENLGIDVLFTSELENRGIQELKSHLYGKISAFSGPSGVGKSSIISHILGVELKRGEVSRKIERGKHTTRHCELLPIDKSSIQEAGLICDTPGFSSPQSIYINFREIKNHIHEFKEYNSECKFKDCIHIDEPSCRIKALLHDGKISPSRYESYKLMVKNSKSMSQ